MLALSLPKIRLKTNSGAGKNAGRLLKKIFVTTRWDYSKHRKRAKLSWRHNIKLSFWSLSFIFLSFCLLSFCLFVWTSLRSNVWRVLSVKIHYVSKFKSGTDPVTHWPTKVRYIAARAAKNGRHEKDHEFCGKGSLKSEAHHGSFTWGRTVPYWLMAIRARLLIT